MRRRSAETYFPWIGGLHSLLDNLIDKHEDEAAGHRSLVEYYGSRSARQQRMRGSPAGDARPQELPHSSRHTVILAAMIGNYLSTPEAHSAELAPVSEACSQRRRARRDRRCSCSSCAASPLHISETLARIPSRRRASARIRRRQEAWTILDRVSDGSSRGAPVAWSAAGG